MSLFYNTKRDVVDEILKDHSDFCVAVQCDLQQEKEVERAIKESSQRFGIPHILIANHAIFVAEDKPIWEMSLNQFQVNRKLKNFAL